MFVMPFNILSLKSIVLGIIIFCSAIIINILVNSILLFSISTIFQKTVPAKCRYIYIVKSLLVAYQILLPIFILIITLKIFFDLPIIIKIFNVLFKTLYPLVLCSTYKHFSSLDWYKSVMVVSIAWFVMLFCLQLFKMM